MAEVIAQPKIRRVTLTGCAAAVSALVLIWMLVARVLGPTDLWDQSQPKTVSYTSDIIANGNRVLPIERGAYPATKPPLYNWLAAPAVAMLGFNSEIAHKLPSVMALCACWVIVVRLGRRVFGDLLGWLAGLMFIANYAMFKLGYLARPDMLLVLWLTLGWAAATSIMASADWRSTSGTTRFALASVFWISIALGALTKGPAVLVALVYALPAARVIAGHWSAVNRLQWWWGLPVSLCLFAAWVVSAWFVDSRHVIDQLWYAEFYGRVTGTGPEGSQEGPIGLLRTIHVPAFYNLTRFAPWSVLSIAAMVMLLRRDRQSRRARWRSLPAPQQSWLLGAMLFVVITVGLFTLSSSKKPDYIAPAVPMSALLAAWWITQLPAAITSKSVIAVAAVALVTMTAMMIVNIRQPAAPSPDFGRGIDAFIDDAATQLARRPAPVVFCWTGNTHLQAMLGYSTVDDTAAFEQQYASSRESGQPFWVIAGRRKGSPPMFDAWVADRERFDANVEVVVMSEHLDRAFGWPEQVGLYWVEPRRVSDDSAAE